MNLTIGEAFYFYKVDEGNAVDSSLCMRHGLSQVQMSGLVKRIYVARQNTGNRNSDKNKESLPTFRLWENDCRMENNL